MLCHDKDLLHKVYGMIKDVKKGNKYLIEGEEDVNKVIIMTKNASTPEDQRHNHMEKVLKEWGINKGLWLTEMRIK